MQNPLVSCILTTFNRKELLIRSLSSILNQTYKNLEIIIVDDFSTDGTKDLIEHKFLKLDQRTTYIRHEYNKGLASARNSGLEKCKGDFIAFLDDDDEWINKKIELQLQIFKNSNLKNLGMVTCGIRRITKDTVLNYRETLRGNLFKELIDKQALIGNGSCVMIKKDVFSKHGGFDTRYKIGIDGYFFTKVSKNYEIDFCKEILVNYDEESNNRITKVSAIQNKIYAFKLRIKNNLLEFKKFPKELSNVYFKISEFYIILKNYKNAKKYLNYSISKNCSLKKILFAIMLKMSPRIIRLILCRMHNVSSR